jgi:diguanylate cyclase (GGDEF)-like protein/PAS domain S-box-containing protein
MEQMTLYPLANPKLKSPPSKWRLLVVDDEIGMGESLRLLLSHLGYEVTVADSGEMALEQLHTKPFDLVITDLVMDRINGYDILNFINQEEFPIPVVVLTGLDSVDAAVKALKQGAYDLILKPFDFENFKASIHRAIEKRQLEMIQRIQKQRIDTVARIARAVTSTLKLDEIFQIIVQQSREFLEFDSAVLALLNKEKLSVDVFAVSHDGQDHPEGRDRFSLDHPVFSALLSSRVPLLVPDLLTHQDFGSADLPLIDKARSCSLVPLVTKDRVVGALLFASRHPYVYGQQDLEFLSPIADQVAVAVDNARLLDLEQRRSRQLEVLDHIGKQLTSALVVEKLLEKAIYLLKDHFPYRHIDIFYFDENRTQLIRYQYQEDTLFRSKKPSVVGLDEGVVGRVAQTGRTMLVQDVAQEPSYREAFHDTVVELAVPLKTEDEVFGVLNVEDTALRRFTEDDRVVMEAVASQISLAWKNAKLFQQIRESKHYLELVLNSAADLSIISIDRSGRIVTFNSGSEKLLGLMAAEAAGKDINKVIRSKTTRKAFKSLIRKFPTESWEDELEVERPDKKTFWAHMVVHPIVPDLERVVGFLVVLTDVTRRIELENELRQLTVTDDLTGLYNQRSFFKQLKREIKRTQRRNTPLSLCIFDLDRFKTYNDRFGHLAGDEILTRLGAVISRTIRVGIDLPFRYGGDEFCLLLPDTAAREALTSVERLRRAITKEFDDQISISAGIGEYLPNMEEKDFIESIDRLMYLAKRDGGDKVMVAAPDAH